MRQLFKRAVLVVAAAGVLVGLVGCTDWKKEHAGLEVEHANTKGRLERSEGLRGESEAEIQRLREAVARLNRERDKWEATSPEELGGVIWEAREEDMTIRATLSNEILFAPGSAKLKATTIKELDDVHSVLRSRYADREISVVGHTDSDPIKATQNLWKDNWELSTARALAVVRYLVGRGMPKDQIVAAGAGENRPVEKNATSQGKAKNRRVEVVVYMF